ncbi:high choriolytic enzyme 1-like [Betta splendens]|uniref:Metalloendopeptidase n=1 Tax=Betta splendens TaxID=158456 RepID=A0A6P7M2W2_BETSP|nr:high choriolytic enzyme 1-like [Betta splendens]
MPVSFSIRRRLLTYFRFLTSACSKMTRVLFVVLLLSVTPMFLVCKPLQSENLLLLPDEMLDVSEIITKANRNISKFLIHGDIMPSRMRNADPCVKSECMWPKTGAYVYVPIEISNNFTRAEVRVIMKALMGFEKSTCIRFTWRSDEKDYIQLFSGKGCWSSVGRQREMQQISLQKGSCVHVKTVQHEVLHALGFHHEQTRSDRDTYVDIHWENIKSEDKSNFEKLKTYNLYTPYDYNSVMQYHNLAFSINGKPTITAKTNPDLILGSATEMNDNDIARVNRLYCSKI